MSATRDGEPTLLHAYAITGHIAQGMTVDHALVLADEGINREWAYVALSRGRQSNRLYLSERHDDARGGVRTDGPRPRRIRSRSSRRVFAIARRRSLRSTWADGLASRPRMSACASSRGNYGRPSNDVAPHRAGSTAG